MAAFWRVVPLDCPNFTVRIVDVKIDEPEATAQIIAEVRRAPANETVACRGVTRWQPIYEPISIGKEDEQRSGGLTLRPGGMYLITGGTGGMGLVLARHIARESKGVLILTARTPAPSPDQWDALLSSPDTAPELRAKIEGLRSIHNAGGQVLTLQADAADGEAMRRVLAEVQRRYGAVHGIIHAAGIARGRIIQSSDPQDVRAVLAPKVQAAEWIRGSLVQPQLDFVLLCSSISAVMPFVAQSDYGAANAWMDGFATIHDNPGGVRVISVNWDTWREVGMAVSVKLPAALEEARRNVLQTAIWPEEATVVFDRILAVPMPQIVVSTRDLERRRREATPARSSINGPAGEIACEPTSRPPTGFRRHTGRS